MESIGLNNPSGIWFAESREEPRGGEGGGSIHIPEGEEEIARHLIAKPAAGHAGRNF